MPPDRALRVALVWFTEDLVLARTSAPYGPYTAGFRELGHEAVTVAPARAAEGYPLPVRTVPRESSLADPGLWRELAADVVLGWTWHRMDDALAAARQSGAKIINLSDSDGQISPRVHPLPSWRFAVDSQPTLRLRLGATRLWVKRFLRLYRPEHAAAVAALRHSDALVFCSRAAGKEFARILDHEGASELANRIAVVPYPVGAAFCTGPVPAEREVRVVSAARWDAGQKNAGLMAAALRRVVRARADVGVVLAGRGGEAVFAGLCRECPRVRYVGVCPPERVAEYLGGGRVLAMSSRWESGPIVAFEALAMGATLAAAPIHNLAEFAAGGAFGRVGSAHTPRALADAILAELAAWDDGRRDPAAIAAHWRERVSPVAVCRALLAAVGLAGATVAAAGVSS